jgi:hypothetical protein
MENKSRTPNDPLQNESRQLRVVPGTPSATPPAREVERRLDSLVERVRNLKPDSSLVWLEDRLHVFDPVLDLRVKVEAVRLMLRAAELLSDRDKERVLLTVRNSLEQLEKAVELGVHAA